MRPSNVTPEQFREWRLNQGFNRDTAASRLGVSPSSIFNYEEGKRNEGEVKIPLTVALAMSAVENNLKPYGEEK